MTKNITREDLLYPELSYKIIGCAYSVYNAIGAGHLEKVYQRALAVAFRNAGLNFEEQLEYDLQYAGQTIGVGRLDFLVEKKIVVELKRGNFNPAAFAQVLEYLQSKDLELGLLIRFGKEQVHSRRVLNQYKKGLVA